MNQSRPGSPNRIPSKSTGSRLPVQRILTIAALALVLVLLFGARLPGAQAAGGAQAEEKRAVIYLFWGDGCPHCEAARPALAQIAAQNPGAELREFEVWYDEDNQKKFVEFATQYGFEAGGVPTIFLGTHYWIGWTDALRPQVEAAVAQCLTAGCPDPEVDDIQAALAAQQPAAGPPAEEPPAAQDQPGGEEPQATQPAPVVDPPAAASVINLPLLGAVDLGTQSLAVSTLLIAFVDGFNPCSLWVLSMLMALTLHTGSRRKILLIGIIFLTVTAGIYALFIAGLFSFLKIISFVDWIQAAVALIALVFAVINIKDYFWYKEGVSLTISDEAKPGIAARMRKVIASSDSFLGLAAATVGLAAGVSLVEFSCTAGLPVIWTNLLTAHGVTAATFVALLLLYLLVYQIDELIIFGTVVFTLKASRMEEKQGRILKLIGGSLMLTLAVVMLVNPQAMNDLGNSLLIFLAAFGLAGLVLLLHRVLLPKIGIWIGTEEQPKGKKPRRRASHR